MLIVALVVLSHRMGILHITSIHRVPQNDLHMTRWCMYKILDKLIRSYISLLSCMVCYYILIFGVFYRTINSHNWLVSSFKLFHLSMSNIVVACLWLLLIMG